MRKRKNLKYFAIIALCVWGLFFNTMRSIRKYSKNYSESPADVAIVLGAGTANGKISQVFEQRLLHAKTLLEKNVVDHVILTGGYGEGQKISDALAAKNYLIHKGVEAEKLFLEDQSKITYYNVKNAKDIMNVHDWSTALVVSDPYHMKRAMHMCKKMEVEALPSPTPTSMYRSRSTKLQFLVTESWNYWAYILFGQHRRV